MPKKETTTEEIAPANAEENEAEEAPLDPVATRLQLLKEIGQSEQHRKYVDSRYPDKEEEVGPFLDEFAPTRAKRTRWERILKQVVQ